MKKSIITAVLFLAAFKGSAQDFTFSQFYDVPLYRNPAIAGIYNGNLRLTSAYRSQWGSVTVPYQTQAFSAEVSVPVGYSYDLITYGIQLANDVAGDLKLGRTQFLPVFCFHKSLNEDISFLTFGVMGGYIQSQFDPTKVLLGSQFNYNDPMNPYQNTFTSRTSFSYLDASTGLAFNSEFNDGTRYYYGVSVYHFLRSKVYFIDQSSSILRPRFSLNGGINFVTGNFDHLYMFGDAMVQGGNRQLIMGMYYTHNVTDYDDERDNIALSGGASYRWADAVIPTARMQMRHLQLGVSYDLNISKLKSASQYRGGLELTLSYVNTLNALRSRKYKEHLGCYDFPKRF